MTAPLTQAEINATEASQKNYNLSGHFDSFVRIDFTRAANRFIPKAIAALRQKDAEIQKLSDRCGQQSILIDDLRSQINQFQDSNL